MTPLYLPAAFYATRITYENQLGASATWESAERTTRPPGVGVDGVGILAVLEGQDGEPAKILLQKQFRPPVGKVCIELPAGLIDAGESPAECALSDFAGGGDLMGTG